MTPGGQARRHLQPQPLRPSMITGKACECKLDSDFSGPKSAAKTHKVNLDSVSRFRGKNQHLADAARAVLATERPMTLRQLFYRLVSAGKLRNDQKDYKRLGNVMTRLREARIIPRTWIVDHVRSTLKPSSWTGLADFSDSVKSLYRKNLWAGLPDHVEVFVEKDAIAGTLQPVTEEYDVRLRVCRGYSSVSFAGEIADLWARVKKPVHAYFLGDFDPSGFDLERDLREKLERYSGRACILGDEPAGPRSFRWTRLAVEEDDFVLHNLIRLPVKTRDRRASGFIRQYGHDCAEIDALSPLELRRRLEEAIRFHIDVEEWQRLQEIEMLEQQSLDMFLSNWKSHGQGG